MWVCLRELYQNLNYVMFFVVISPVGNAESRSLTIILTRTRCFKANYGEITLNRLVVLISLLGVRQSVNYAKLSY